MSLLLSGQGRRFVRQDAKGKVVEEGRSVAFHNACSRCRTLVHIERGESLGVLGGALLNLRIRDRQEQVLQPAV